MNVKTGHTAVKPHALSANPYFILPLLSPQSLFPVHLTAPARILRIYIHTCPVRLSWNGVSCSIRKVLYRNISLYHLFASRNRIHSENTAPSLIQISITSPV